jgi:hypothetical protein
MAARLSLSLTTWFGPIYNGMSRVYPEFYMPLQQRLMDEMKEAMKSGDQARL